MLAAVTCVVFFVPWCVAVSPAIVLFPRVLTQLVCLYALPPHMPLHLTYHAHTAREHVGILAARV